MGWERWNQGGWVPPLDTLNDAVWPEVRRTILDRVLKILGPFPDTPEHLDAQVLSEEDAGDHIRKKVVLLPEDEDPLFMYLLVPKEMSRPAPAVLCLHSTTKGSGKDLPAGVAGAAPGNPPIESRAYALHLVRRGYVALAPDMLADGERIPKGLHPYDTSEFYRRYPDWSATGKIIWDSMRAIDYLFTLDIVDTERIGAIGHSHGAHYCIFTAMFDERIKAVVCNGGAIYWWNMGEPRHWALCPPRIVHMPRLRPFYDKGKFPMEFWEFISPIAPRPLLCMDGEDDANHGQFRRVYEAMWRLYKALGWGREMNLTWFSYPGGHDFPPAAHERACSWFDNFNSILMRIAWQVSGKPLEGNVTPNKIH